MSNLELNKGDNFIFGIDVSASMQQADCPGGLSRIEYLKERVIAFAREASKWDEDGIDVFTFGHAVMQYPKVTEAQAEALIRPLSANEGATMTHLLIDAAYRLHKTSCSKQTVLFVATDGEPSDKEALKKAIIDVAADLDNEHEFAISFLTVGVPSPQLAAFLSCLDDDLKGAKYDIVDVKKLEEVDFMTAFSGALHD